MLQAHWRCGPSGRPSVPAALCPWPSATRRGARLARALMAAAAVLAAVNSRTVFVSLSGRGALGTTAAPPAAHGACSCAGWRVSVASALGSGLGALGAEGMASARIMSPDEVNWSDPRKWAAILFSVVLFGLWLENNFAPSAPPRPEVRGAAADIEKQAAKMQTGVQDGGEAR
mmetsp:Transcript_37745/g.108806  ORF Transcript_37745/g.108806 Transcript_37745/m.108806 type:complete len:173 (-) Transcript_37745:65-583(-)